MKKTVFIVVMIISIGAFSEDTMKVGYSEFPPMLFEENGEFRGFDYDFLQSISEDLGFATVQFVELPRNEKFQALADGQVDFLMSGISITAEREELFNSSKGYLDSGLLFATIGEKPSIFKTNLKIFLTIISFLVLLFVCALVVWYAEQGTGTKNGDEDPGRHIDDRFYQGMFDSIWYCWISLTTIGYGDIVVKTKVGRVAIIIITAIGLGFAANLIGEISSLKMTVHGIKPVFDDISELDGKRVGIVSGTTSSAIKEIVYADYVEYSNIDELGYRLKNGEVDAIIYDVPAIKYIVNQYEDTIVELGPVMFEQSYGIYFREDDIELKEQFDQSILRLKERGVIQGLKAKWFGTSRL